MPIGSNTKCFCNVCSLATNHEVLFQRETQDHEELDDHYVISWTITHELLQCRGCDSVVLRTLTVADWDGSQSTSFYPPRIARRLPAWTHSLPEPMKSVLKETYQALQSDSPTLSLMGARAILDLAANATLGDVGGFAQKLKALSDAGHLSAAQVRVIEPALEAGHAASHRGYRPPKPIVDAVMDIIEHMLQSMFVLKDLASRIRESVPPRPPISQPDPSS